MILRFNNEKHLINLQSITSFTALQQSILELTSIETSNQKIINKGKVLYTLDNLTDKDTLLLVGSKNEAFVEINRENIKLLNQFVLPKGVPYRDKEIKSTYFSRYKVLTSFLNHELARDYLIRLANDRGIVEIMKKRKYNVGLLSEIHPNEDSTILGFNKNKGEEIALRLRTNDLDGFRHYKEVRRVLLHELTHMIHSAHDDKFQELNRTLDRECLQLDWTATKGRTISNQEFYQPLDNERYGKLLNSPEMVDKHGISEVQTLGGGSTFGDDSNEDPRELARRAAIEREKSTRKP